MEHKWLLCDMHTHSEYSAINKKGDKDKVKKMNASEFVQTMEKNKIEVFSITDHNYFSKSYYEEINAYIISNSLNIKVIPGVEFDTYIDTKNGTDEHIHVCIYFKEDVNYSYLESIVNKLYDKNNIYKGKPKLSNVLNDLFDLQTKFIVIPHGDKERGIFKKVLKHQLENEPDFYKYAMYKIFNAYDVKPNFYEKSIDLWANNFYHESKSFNRIVDGLNDEQIEILKNKIIEKTKNKQIVLDTSTNQIYEYIMKYGSYFAYFSFSDWHNATQYDPKINNFIFGSLENAFESFELATLDPESRIIVEKSSVKKIEIPSSILKEVNFSINGVNHNVSFTPGLNAIVGKRGSGKSLLISIIENLKDKDCEKNGKLCEYKKRMKIDNISGVDRGDISISPGGLNSVVFLSQDDIGKIFEDPSEAENKISSQFKPIQTLDLTPINKIANIASQIKPYDENYKNITNNLRYYKKLDSYSYEEYEFAYNNSIENNFSKAIDKLEEIYDDIEILNIDTTLLRNEINNLEYIKKYYCKLLSLDNEFVKANNRAINTVKTKQNANDKMAQKNRSALNDAKKVIFSNLENKLNYEKLVYAINNFHMNDLPVEIRVNGKYLFATYYDIPDDLKEQIIFNLTKSIYRGRDIDDIYSYINNKKPMNKGANDNLAHYLDEYISGDSLKEKHSFYEIANLDIEYETVIKTVNNLNYQVDKGNLINLTEASLGMKSVAYLDMLFNLDNNILVLDQPEDNIDNDYISNYLVPNIKDKKKHMQLIFVTHNPSVAVYGDAFNYIYVENDREISYKNYYIENVEDKEELMKILEGGKDSFSNRNKKFGNVLGAEEYGVNKN